VYYFRVAILGSILFLWVVPASALTVALVRPPDPLPVVTETLVRLHGELLSVGFEVKIAEPPAIRGTTNTRAWLEELTAEPGIDAAITVVGDAAQVVVEVWVPDKASRRYVVSRVGIEPDTENASERLAIRAIEVLRSSLHESSLTTRQRPGEPIAKPPTAALHLAEETKPESNPERLGFEVGAAALTSLDGVGPAVMPIVRLDWAVRPWLVMQATLAGLGTRPTVATSIGDGEVAQEYGLLGGCFRVRSDTWLWPFFSISAGLLRTSVEGRTEPPRHAHSASQMSFLLDGSLGAGLRLHRRYYLTLATHVQLAEPYVAIDFGNEVGATSGRPNLLLTLTIGAWL
jgi:hypothetical protein